MDRDIDWDHLYEKYEGLWIALADDEQTVVGSGICAEEALRQAKANGCPGAQLTFISAGGIRFTDDRV